MKYPLLAALLFALTLIACSKKEEVAVAPVIPVTTQGTPTPAAPAIPANTTTVPAAVEKN